MNHRNRQASLRRPRLQRTPQSGGHSQAMATIVDLDFSGGSAGMSPQLVQPQFLNRTNSIDVMADQPGVLEEQESEEVPPNAAEDSILQSFAQLFAGEGSTSQGHQQQWTISSASGSSGGAASQGHGAAQESIFQSFPQLFAGEGSTSQGYQQQWTISSTSGFSGGAGQGDRAAQESILQSVAQLLSSASGSSEGAAGQGHGAAAASTSQGSSTSHAPPQLSTALQRAVSTWFITVV